MKKVVAIILLLCLICLSYTVYASETPTEEATVNMKFETATSDNKVTIKISTGNFEGVSEDSVMSASMTLDYNEADISQVSGKTSAGWKITIQENRVLLETDTASSNTTIAELTFDLRDVTEEKSGTISITEFNISDGNNLDEIYETYSANYTIEPNQNDNDNQNNNNDENNNEEENNVQNQITNETLNEVTNETINDTNTENIIINTNTLNKEAGSTVNNAKDNTVSPDSKLPQTGVNIFIIVLIVAIVAFAVVKIIKYKDIEIK